MKKMFTAGLILTIAVFAQPIFAAEITNKPSEKAPASVTKTTKIKDSSIDSPTKKSEESTVDNRLLKLFVFQALSGKKAQNDR